MKKISKALITLLFTMLVLMTSLVPAFAATTPAQVTGVKVSSITYNSAKLSWSKAKNADKYYIENYDASAKKWKVVTNTKSTSYSVTKLTTGTTYQYRIRGYRNIGKTYGKYSSTVKVKPVPATVTGLKASSVTPVSAKLSWTAVTGATGYVVQTYDATNKKWVNVNKVKTKSISLTKLTPNTTLKYKVAAYTTVSKKDIMGAYSSELSVKTTVAQVTGLKATQTNPTATKLTWTKVTGATSYIVYKDGKSPVTVTTNSATVKSLVPGTAYKFTVKAITTVSKKDYAGKVSSAVSFTPSIGQVTGLKASSIKTTSVKLSWTKLDAAQGYQVYNGSTLVEKITAADTVSYTVSGLKAGTKYTFKVVPYYSKYDGTASKTVSVVTLCSAPKNLQTEEVLTNSIEISWSAVSKAAKYVVYIDNSKVLETTDTYTTLKNLTKNKSYTISVTAANSSNAESSKATIAVKTPNLDISLRDVSITSYNTTTKKMSYRILWYACAKTGDEVYRYKVRDNYEAEDKILDFILYTADTTPNAFDLTVSEGADGFTTVSWPAVANAKYYEVQVSPVNDSKNSWATVATTSATSTKVVLAPSSELNVRVLAYDRVIGITAYDTQLEDNGDYTLVAPHTSERIVRIPGKVSAYTNITTKAADITKTDNMSKTKAVLTVVQAINNTKNEKDSFKVAGSRNMTAKVNKSTVDFERKKLFSSNWKQESLSLDAFLRLFPGGSDMIKDVASDLQESQSFNLVFANGKGQGTVIEEGKTQQAYGVDLSSIITPTERNATLYNAIDIASIDSKVSGIKVVKGNNGITTIEFDIKKETATPSNPTAPVHAGLYDSMADSLDSMDELGSKSKIDTGDTHVKAVINKDGTLDSLNITSAFVFIMSMSMDGEVDTDNDEGSFRNICITMNLSGTSTADYKFTDRA